MNYSTVNIFTQMQQHLIHIVETIKSQLNLPATDASGDDINLIYNRINVEPAKDPNHGDLATNAAMVLSKAFKMQPRALAEKIIECLQALPQYDQQITNIEIAGPGFINITMSNDFWYQQLKTVLNESVNYGKANLGKGATVNVEFVSANPTGPLHAGHGRNAVLGDTISSLLDAVGYKVTREYYINDAGGQINALARSVYVRYREACGEEITEADFDQDMYGGDYLQPIAREIYARDNNAWLAKEQAEWMPYFKDLAIKAMLDMIKKDLLELGVKMDVFTSEQALNDEGKVQKTLDALKKRGDVYEGTLPPPKGIDDKDWEPRPQVLFKATSYGDDVDRALQKSDHTWTYFAGDVAYHYDKLCRDFDSLVNVFGADHSGYVKRIQSAVLALSENKKHLDIKVSQMVNFFDNGVSVRMSKRAGTFITLREVVERVGKDATRYMMVSRSPDMPIDFDFFKVVDQSRDNPIFYIQYAHARIKSVLRNLKESFTDINLDGYLKDNISILDFTVLNDSQELCMIKALANWPRQLQMAASFKEPHRVANFLYDVAKEFHSLWNKGKENTNLRFINPSDIKETMVRIALITATATVIANGLKLLGITPAEELR